MSSWEVLYRVVEQLKRIADRVAPRDWRAFDGFDGPIYGLPGLRPPDIIDALLKDLLDTETSATLAGRFTLLGQTWPSPPPQIEPWWTGPFWLVDPISERLWPGAETAASAVSYREGAGRGDVKFVWELNRLQFLPPLALQASLKNDASMSEAVFAILRGWVQVNPPNRGVNWISGVEAASRVVSVLAALSFLSPSAKQKAAVLSFLYAHRRWIERYPSRFSSANNHRIAELTAVFLISVCAPGLPGSPRRRRRAQAELEREILKQFHADGVGAEQSVAYAAYSLEWLTLAGFAAEATDRPFSQYVKDRALAALDHLCWLMDEAGGTPRIGDSDDGGVLALTQAPDCDYVLSVTAMTARWLGAPAPSPALRRCPALRDLMGDPTTLGDAPTGRQTFTDGGMTIWRRPRPDGTLLLAFDHGPLGHRSIAAHGHADALAIWVHWGDEAVFVDPGTYLYHAESQTRAALRRTAAHNTLCLAGEDQSRIIGPFAWSDHARARLTHVAGDDVEAEHDGYRRRFGLIHRRRVRIEGDAIIIEDRLLGRAKRPHPPWCLGFTLAPGVDAAVDGSTAKISTPAGRRLILSSVVFERAAPSWSLIRTPYAPAFGTLDCTNRLLLSGVVDHTPLLIRTKIVMQIGSYQAKPS